MFTDVVCSCGKSLRAYEGMAEILCPACRKAIRVGNAPLRVKTQVNETRRKTAVRPNTSDDDDDPADNRSEVVVFGFDPPPPRVQKAPLNYDVVEVSSETTAPNPNPKKPVEPDRSDEKFQRKLWGPKVDLEADFPDVRRKRSRRRRGDWALERAWYECLAYPIRGLPLVGALGAAFAIATFGLLQVLREDAVGGWFFYLLGCAALTYACGFLTCVLQAGARGNYQRVQWPRANLKLLLESVLGALLSFLAGPIVPAGVGVYFWLNSGELALIDYLILLELAMVTVGYWLLVFVSVSLSDQWSAMLPAAVVKQGRQLGVGRTLVALGIVLAVFFFHAWLAVTGIENHQSAASFLLLLICWSSLMFWMVFLMRWLGVSLHRRRAEPRKGSE